MTLKALILIDRRYPADHSFLRGVVREQLEARGWNLEWLMRAPAGATETAARDAYWRNARVTVLGSHDKSTARARYREQLVVLRTLATTFLRHKRESFDIIYVRNSVPMLLYAHLLGLVGSAKIIYQLSHFKEEELIESRVYGDGSIVNAFDSVVLRLLTMLRNWLASRADVVLAISTAMKRRLVDYGLSGPRIEVMGLGIDVQALRENTREQESHRAIYIGTIAASRQIEQVISAFCAACAQDDDWQLVIFASQGEDELASRLRHSVNARNLGNRVVIERGRARDELYQSLAEHAFGVSLIPQSATFSTLSPTKLMEYLGAGLPVIASHGVLEQEEIVKASQAGVLVDFTEDAMCEGFRAMMARTDRSVLGKKGREWICKHRSYETMGRRLDALLRSVASQRCEAVL